jgi:hypothetical protein
MRDEGLYGKYLVYDAEAEGQFDEYHPVSDVFVLRPTNDPAARAALGAYAKATDNLALSRDLWRWLAEIGDNE